MAAITVETSPDLKFSLRAAVGWQLGDILFLSSNDKNSSVKEKPKLTSREKEIVQLAVDGHTNKEIGEQLYISPNTVKTQLKNIFEKLGVNSRALLERYLETSNELK